jgi:hypothetical protein
MAMRGLESVEHAFKEGEKQTMIWREELESCGEQRGRESFGAPPHSETNETVSVDEIHSHLFQLLITGRGSPAVTEWLGNRLTGRVC